MIYLAFCLTNDKKRCGVSSGEGCSAGACEHGPTGIKLPARESVAHFSVILMQNWLGKTEPPAANGGRCGKVAAEGWRKKVSIGGSKIKNAEISLE